MLETIPHTIWPELLHHIRSGVQRGRIDTQALWTLCRRLRDEASSGTSCFDELQAWASRWQALPPSQVTQITLVPRSLLARADASEGAPPNQRCMVQLQLPWQHEPQNIFTASLEVVTGMPDIVAFALALTLRARKIFDVPTLMVHPALTDAACEALGKSRGRAILGLIAEMGLAGRPWHLWLGTTTPQARLSPYVRDLGEALWRWGEAHDLVPPNDGAEPASGVERDAIVLDTLAEAFVATHAGLAAERTTAERSVGITQARVDGLDIAVVDLGRAVAELWDARLPSANPWAGGDRAQAPLLVQVDTVSDASDERVHAAMVARLCFALGVTLASVTVCKSALLMREHAHCLRASSLLDIACDRSLPCDGAGEDASVCADALPYAMGAVSDASRRTAEPTDEPLAAAAWVAGGGHLWARLLRLRHRGILPRSAPLQLDLVRLHDLRGPDAVALDCLRRLLTPQATVPAHIEKKSTADIVRRGRGLRV